MEIKRNSFLFYYSYYDAIHDIESEEEQCQMYKIIVDYAMRQIEPTNLTPMQKMAFKLIKPNLDASIRKWQNGLKGGAPKGNKNAKKQPKNNQETSKNQPKNNLKTTLYIKEQEQDNEQDEEQEQEGEQEQTNLPTADSSLDSSQTSAKIEFYLSVLNDKVNDLTTADLITAEHSNRLKELFNQVASKPEIKINKKNIGCAKVLEQYVNFFSADENIVVNRICELFYIVDNKPDIKNKLKYAMGVFYNKSTGY